MLGLQPIQVIGCVFAILGVILIASRRDRPGKSEVEWFGFRTNISSSTGFLVFVIGAGLIVLPEFQKPGAQAQRDAEKAARELPAPATANASRPNVRTEETVPQPVQSRNDEPQDSTRKALPAQIRPVAVPDSQVSNPNSLETQKGFAAQTAASRDKGAATSSYMTYNQPSYLIADEKVYYAGCLYPGTNDSGSVVPIGSRCGPVAANAFCRANGWKQALRVVMGETLPEGAMAFHYGNMQVVRTECRDANHMRYCPSPLAKVTCI